MAGELLSILAPGIYARPGVRIDQRRIAYLQAVRARLPQGFPALIVTSGDRSATEQASAMLGKLSAGGWEELYRVYPDALIAALQALPSTLEAWAAYINAAAQRGVLYSAHMRGDALDLRTTDLSRDELQQLYQAAASAGGRPLVEGAPPHLHIDRIQAGALLDPRLVVLRLDRPSGINGLLSVFAAAIVSIVGGTK